MKSIFVNPRTLAAAAVFCSANLLTAYSPAQATVIIGGSYDPKTDSAILEVNYSGGCREHKFTLEYTECNESYPTQATAQLIHETEDMCKADITTTVSIPLADFTCRPADLVIESDDGGRADLRVPFKGQPFPTLPRD